MAESTRILRTTETVHVQLYGTTTNRQLANPTRVTDESSCSCRCFALRIFTGVFSAISVSMIVMGALYYHDCPRQPYITLYLIVGGSVGLVTLFGLLRNLLTKESTACSLVNTVLCFFLAIWSIVGSVWIYRIYGDFDTVLKPLNPLHYCYLPLYHYAFWVTAGSYGLFVLGLFCLMCACCCICLQRDSN